MCFMLDPIQLTVEVKLIDGDCGAQNARQAGSFYLILVEVATQKLNDSPFKFLS